MTTDDLIRWLREDADRLRKPLTGRYADTMDEAAKEIERLQDALHAAVGVRIPSWEELASKNQMPILGGGAVMTGRGWIHEPSVEGGGGTPLGEKQLLEQMHELEDRLAGMQDQLDQILRAKQ